MVNFSIIFPPLPNPITDFPHIYEEILSIGRSILITSSTMYFLDSTANAEVYQNRTCLKISTISSEK